MEGDIGKREENEKGRGGGGEGGRGRGTGELYYRNINQINILKRTFIVQYLPP